LSRFSITTPIYYVNADPHLGHAYTTIAADILARYHRQLGDDVFFLTGTDEHGNKVAQAAEERGLTPREHVDTLAPKFREMTLRVNADNDFFIRTTDPQHEAYVQRFVEKLRAAGDIEKRSYGGLYCTACEAFYYERDLVAGKCPIHGTEPVWLEEENYYFLLSRYQDRLREYYLGHPGWVRPKSRYNEALSFIEGGLDDISISRKSITWGIPVPWDPEQVIYVWVDALINYVSALTYARPGDDLVERFWPADVHLLAKDILKFHAVIWPALLWSAGYEAPRSEFIHGYLLMGGEKMSKTRGNVLDPFAVIEQRGADALRFYLFREVTFGLDGVISLEGFEQRYNNELANELGNLVSRTVSMIAKYRAGVIPTVGAAAAAAVPGGAAGGGGSGDAGAGDGSEPGGAANLAPEGEAMVAAAGEHLSAVEITVALETVWEFVRRLNRYVEEEAPWKLAKDEAAGERLDFVLHGLACGLRLVALVLYPVVPGTAVEILRRLGQASGPADLLLAQARWDGLVPAAVVSGPPLFPRIEAEAHEKRG
jgi:methionyl-tRNA synthetase